MRFLSPIPPGVVFVPEPPTRRLSGVRLDTCAFAGVAPRGPCRVPVVDEVWTADAPFMDPSRPRLRSVPILVESYAEYRRLFGGTEGPGQLPHAVSAFFAQGGRRAYIIRIVREYTSDANLGGVASGALPGIETAGGDVVVLRARDEGSWGNRVRVAIRFFERPVFVDGSTPTTLQVPLATHIPEGTLLRISGGGGASSLRFAAAVAEVGLAESPSRVKVITLDAAFAGDAKDVTSIDASILVRDGDGRAESHERLGLSPVHPRWMGRVLSVESALVYPSFEWEGADLVPTAAALVREPGWSEYFTGGEDRYSEITPDDFFDDGWVPGNSEPASGVHCLAHVRDVGLLAAPDLYAPFPEVATESIVDVPSLAGPSFTPCVFAGGVAEQGEAPAGLTGLRLDPLNAAELALIIGMQKRLVDFAEDYRGFIALLDVPPGLKHRDVLRWRRQFSSAYAAAYHPWLRFAPPDAPSSALVTLNPSAVAAGIIAWREVTSGVPHGPANAIAQSVVALTELMSEERHGELHDAGVNVYVQEREGVRLTGARTLAGDAAYRQLNVRRLMTLIAKSIEAHMQWTVFEPNAAQLRSEVRNLVVSFLRGLFRAGAFAGATEEDSFFVRCDENNNPQRILDAGQLVVDIGVAPAEPVEFIVVRLIREADGGTKVEG